MINSNRITVLSVGPADEHQKLLAHILKEAAVEGRLACCSKIEAAIDALRFQRVPVLLCDSQADWRGLLEHLGELPDPPYLIVTSRLADDRLWSEALNLGAYDVLAKPFDRTEVTRVLRMASVRWLERSTEPFWFPRGNELSQPACA